MGKKIKLEEILDFYCCVPDYDKVAILNAMKDACRKTLELAAENATTKKEMIPIVGVFKTIGEVNKQSIIDTIKQVQQWKRK